MEQEIKNEVEATSEQKAVSASTRKRLAVQKPKKAPKKKPANGKVRYLTADDIMGTRDINEEEVFVDEWGGTLIIRSLTSAAHEKLVASCMEGPPKQRTFNMVGYQSKMVTLCCFTQPYPDGGRVFSDAHAPLLAQKSSGPVTRIAQVCQRLSGLDEESVKKIRENLEQTPKEGSVTV